MSARKVAALPAPGSALALVRKDLERSGLVDVAKALHVEALEPDETYTFMVEAGFEVPLRVASAVFYYFNADGSLSAFWRLKPLGPPTGWDALKETSDVGPKYLQPPHSIPEVYLPPLLDRPWSEVLADPSITLWVTEGEKKAAAMCRLGFACIGLGGVGSWRARKRGIALLRVLAEIDPGKHRLFNICFDYDRVWNPNVERERSALAAEMSGRGFAVNIGYLPPGPGGDKNGLDDLIERAKREGRDPRREVESIPLRGALMATRPRALVSIAEDLDQPQPETKYVIRPFFPAGEVTEISGASGIGKSTVALYGSLCVATGASFTGRWAGLLKDPKPTAFVTLEDGKPRVVDRIQSWLQALAPKDQDEAKRRIKEHFRVLTRDDVRGLSLTATDRSGTVIRDDALDCYAELLKGRELTIMETVARLHPGDESNEGLAMFASALETLARYIGEDAALGVVRHVSKVAAREEQADPTMGRGGVAMSDAVRSIISAVRHRPENGADAGPFTPLRLRQEKHNDGESGAELFWKPTVWRPATDDRPSKIYWALMSAEDRVADDERVVLAWLRDLGRVTRKDLRKKGMKLPCSRLRTEAALDRLLAKGQIIRQKEKRGTTQAEVYRLRPVKGQD